MQDISTQSTDDPQNIKTILEKHLLQSQDFNVPELLKYLAKQLRIIQFILRKPTDDKQRKSLTKAQHKIEKLQSLLQRYKDEVHSLLNNEKWDRVFESLSPSVETQSFGLKTKTVYSELYDSLIQYTVSSIVPVLQKILLRRANASQRSFARPEQFYVHTMMNYDPKSIDIEYCKSIISKFKTTKEYLKELDECEIKVNQLAQKYATHKLTHIPKIEVRNMVEKLIC